MTTPRRSSRALRHVATSLALLATLLGPGAATPAGAPTRAREAPPAVPLRPGLVVVYAVRGDERGDYEGVVRVQSVTDTDVVENTTTDYKRPDGGVKHFRSVRRVLWRDIREARTQFQGFLSPDAEVHPGTTSLGPSLTVMADLRRTGRAAFRLYDLGRFNTGTLTRVEAGPVPFPVLINGRRVNLPAVHATGQLRYAERVRLWEFHLLDDPAHPLQLRVARGAERDWGIGDFLADLLHLGSKLPPDPEWTAQVVRLDFPAASESRDVERALAEECRAPLHGVYFDFASATLNPASDPALKTIADLLRRHPEWTVRVEGHTDSIGGDRFNRDLSQRRAEAVRAALVERFRVAPRRLAAAGFGATRPVETNATLEGRARNRRVELVRSCGAEGS
jgi:outer membrane protein OmpA-like peptidoglycan-associated protein